MAVVGAERYGCCRVQRYGCFLGRGGVVVGALG